MVPFHFIGSFTNVRTSEQHREKLIRKFLRMKRPKNSERASFSKKGRNGQRERLRNGNQINDMLKMCLEKVCELQKDLKKQDELEDDPQAAGYSACAVETLRFLAQEGLPADHPMVQVLTEKLTGANP